MKFRFLLSVILSLALMFLVYPSGIIQAFWNNIWFQGSPSPYLAQMEGTSYKIITDSLNSGGTDFSSSNNYILSDTIGENATGISTSTNFILSAGYRQLQDDSYISISSELDVDLGSVSGIASDYTTGSATWTVITDNSAGYSLTIEATSSPAMMSNGSEGYYFNDFYPRGAGYESLEFDGVDQYAKITDNIVSSPSELTIISRFKKLSGGNGTYEATMHKGSSATVGSSDYWTGVNDLDYLVATIGANQSGIGWNAGLTTIQADGDTWYDVAAVWDGSVVKVYVDGVYQHEYNLTTYGNLNIDTRFGAVNDGTTYQFKGYIGENRIYTRALNESEIEAFSADAPISNTNLIGVWRFDDGSGSNISDYSGNNNDATAYNDPVWTNYSLEPEYNFTLFDTQSIFGISPEGNDIVDRFKDNGSVCGTGILNTADKCWVGLSTDAFTVSESTSSNQPAGETTTIKFRAENGSSHIQEAATYEATIIMTAVTL